jgi:hypothetical protein
VDAGIITNVLLLLGLGAVGGGVAGVHTLVNGNTTKQLAITSEANAQQLAIISDAVGKLAAAQPPSDPSSPGPDDTQVLTHV